MQRFIDGGAAAALASGGFVDGESAVTWLSPNGTAPEPPWQGPALLEEEPFLAQCFGSSATETRRCDSDLAGLEGAADTSQQQEVLAEQNSSYSATLGWVLALIAAGLRDAP